MVHAIHPTPTPTMQDYRKENDLVGAYKRYQSATKSWQGRWWKVVEDIFNACTAWAKYFILDPIKRELKKLGRGRIPNPATLVNHNLIFNVPAEGCGAYIVQHFNKKGKHLWIKCGKADDAIRRLNQHFAVDYANEADSGVVLGWYPCKNEDHALAMEDVIRNHFKQKGYAIKGKDRFPTLYEVTEEDFAELNRKAEILAMIF